MQKARGPRGAAAGAINVSRRNSECAVLARLSRQLKAGSSSSGGGLIRTILVLGSCGEVVFFISHVSSYGAIHALETLFLRVLISV